MALVSCFTAILIFAIAMVPLMITATASFEVIDTNHCLLHFDLTKYYISNQYNMSPSQKMIITCSLKLNSYQDNIAFCSMFQVIP